MARSWTEAELAAMRNVVLGGWDSRASYDAAIARGELPAPEFDEYIESAAVPPTTYIATADKGSSLSNNVLGVVASPSPGVMVNTVIGGVWGGFDPNDMAGSLAALRAFSIAMYGSDELGVVRYSSEALENEPTGVRPGTMERIVIPAWARRERGSPL